MQELLKYLKLNWQKEESPDHIREAFRNYIDSVFVSLLRVRHIKLVEEFVWPYLDWTRTGVFGERFVHELLEDDNVKTIIKKSTEAEFQPIDENLFAK